MIRRISLLLVLLLGIGASASAQTTAVHATRLPTRNEISKSIDPLLTQQHVRAIVVVVVNDAGTLVEGFGHRDEQVDALPPDGATVFKIASLTKPLTGLLLAEMALRGQVKLDEPVEQCFEPGTRMPQWEHQSITLSHLATHFSGLPWWPDNFGQPENMSIVIAPYGVGQLIDFMKRHELPQKPGTKYGYSNLGYMLLGQALVHRAKAKSFDALLQERICGPLEMEETRIEPTVPMRQRLTRGYEKNGTTRAADGPPRAGGADAGLFSTGDDLAKFLRANSGLSNTSLDKAVALSHKPAAKIDAGYQYALGWGVDTKTGVLVKNGRSHGYRALMLVWPARRAGAVVLSNTDAEEVFKLAPAMLAWMQGRVPAAAPTPPRVFEIRPAR